MPRAALRTAWVGVGLLVAAVPAAHAACADAMSTLTQCAANAYSHSVVRDATACCALCASEPRCAQWTFHSLSRRCARTDSHEAKAAAIFSTCGVCSPPPGPSPSPPPSPPAPAGDEKAWAVIVAGSSGYWNYRHQADACHAWQLVKAKGIPEERIILMAVDDIANNTENPFPGKMFNRPDPDGPGVDVYAGCKIDYRGAQVTPETFLSVLTGKGNGKVLKSTANDHVFVNFADHGAVGLIAFPKHELHRTQLQQALKQMQQARMFKKLVFYLEACESGSMFEGLDVPGVYALSASNGHESSWGTYCDSPKVDGKDLGTCLGDLFSVSWLQDSDGHDTTKETLQQQFERVRTRTNKSHVMQWGDKSFVGDTVSEYVGSQTGVVSLPAGQADPAASAVSAREVDLRRRFAAYTASATPEQRMAAAERLQAELAQQQQADWVYTRFLELVHPNDEEKRLALRTSRARPDLPECELEVHATLREKCAGRFDANSGFALQFHQYVVNVCEAVARGLDVDAVAMAAQACAEKPRPTAAGQAGAPELVV